MPHSPFYVKQPIDFDSLLIINKKRKVKAVCPHCKKDRLVRVDYFKHSIMGLCMHCSKKISTRHGFHNHSIYHAWEHMKNRCFNKNFKQFMDYGGRGITVCDEWSNSPEEFIIWSLLNGWEEGLTIDRRDNDGNYEPSNCRWVDRFTQMENTRDLHSDNTSGYKGVSFDKKSNSWRAYYSKKNKRLFDKKYFKTAYDASIYREIRMKSIKEEEK